MDNYYKKANVEGKIVGYLPNGLIEVDYAGTPLVVMESENEYAENQPCKLTLAQKREYELLKLHGSVYVYGLKRRGVFEQLKEKGLCHTDGSHHWFHLSKGQSVKECENEYLESSDKAAMSNDDYIVKDKNGQPLIVYHGTPDSRFSEIKNSLMGQESDKLTGGGKGVVWFSDNYRTAKSYADDTRAFDYQNAIPKVFSRYVILKKPLTVDAAGQLWRKVELEINGQKIVGTRNLVDYARKNGYDGLIVKNVYDHYNHFAGQAKDKRNLATNYAVFNDEQIKSIQEHAQGGSMEMYHAGRVEAIGDNHLINELGIHLGSKETADKIGELKGVETKKYKVDIKNPIELPDFPRWEAFVVSRKLKDMGILTENEFEEIRKETGNEKEKLLLQLLKKKGYDGFVYENAFEGGGKSYVAFDKKQVTEYAQGGSLIPEKYRRLGFTAVGKKEKSYLPKKKWMVLAKKGDHYKVVHGGYTGMEDFSEHKDPERRKRFWQRMGGYSKDPFSALYWHKKFGTWEDGGSLAETMQTVRDLAEYDASNPGVLTGTFFSLLKLNDIFRIGQRTYQVTRLTPLKDYSPPFTGKRNISITEQETGKKITGVYLQKKSGSGLWFSSSSSRKSDPWGQLSRNIEGDIIVDLLNENNNFHAFSDAYKMLAAFITQRIQGSPNTETMQTTTKAQSIEEALLFLDDREKKELIKAVQEDVSVLEQAAAILYNDEAKWQEADTLQAEIDALQAILNKHNVCETGQIEKSRSRVVDGKYEFVTSTVVQAFDSVAQLKRYFEKIPISDKSMHSAASAADAGLSFAVPIWHRDSQGRKLWFEYKRGEECPFILRTIDQQTKTVNDQIVMRDWPISVFWPKGVRTIFLDPIFDKVKNHIAHKFLKKDRLFRLTNKNLHEATAAEMYELLFFGHPTEWGLNVSRHAMLTEWERRGEQMTEELGLPTDLDYPYINKHTGPGSIEPLFCQSILLDIYKDATSFKGDCESRIKELKDFYDRAIAEEAKEPLANGRSAEIDWWSVHEHWMPVADIDGAIAFVKQKKAENLALPAPKKGKFTSKNTFDRFQDEDFSVSICALEHWKSKCKQDDNCL